MVVSVVEVVVLVVVVVVGPVHAESSEVLSSGAIAVALRTVPAASGWANVTVKPASPLASVITLSLAPAKVWPSPFPDGSQASLANTSTRKVVFGVELSVPSTLVPPGKSPAASTGKFWRLLAPVSGSWTSFAFRAPPTPVGSPSAPRSCMPSAARGQGKIQGGGRRGLNQLGARPVLARLTSRCGPTPARLRRAPQSNTRAAPAARGSSALALGLPG